MIKIAPSVLSADFSKLGSEIDCVVEGGADLLHVDVMDGIFVPNISVGFPILEAIDKHSDIFLDVHLMIDKPHRYVERFCNSGADLVCFHVEADQPQDILTALADIKKAGKKCGLSIKPKTPASVILPYLSMLDLILVMTVEPGFGGQKFMADQLPKIRGIRALIDKQNPSCLLEVDGGIDNKTAPLVADAGADILVAGNAIFKSSDRAAAIADLKLYSAKS
ncbi:MAG: ribulose-phosphate 3-epimerase [Ruminococcaceae bacterium]|nr:ribulose-phosphate 3-epimerase [Oscillospiraceae bacterium]